MKTFLAILVDGYAISCCGFVGRSDQNTAPFVKNNSRFASNPELSSEELLEKVDVALLKEPRYYSQPHYSQHRCQGNMQFIKYIMPV